MNISSIALNIFLIGIITLFSCCSKDDSINSPVSGQVIDAFSGEAIANVKISIVENGPTTLSDENGNFEFASNDLSTITIEEIEANGVLGVAILLSHEDYRPIEANINYSQKTIFKLAKSTVPAYVYNKPVQLNDGIKVSTLADGKMDIQKIHDGMDQLFRDEYEEIHSILIYKDDRLILEEYLYGNNDTIQFENGVKVDRNPDHIQWSRTEKHYLASVNKTLTSTLVGIALDQNLISVDAKVADYLPEYEEYFANENKAALSFEDCLTMTSGLQWDEWGANDLSLLWKSEDFADFVLSRSSFGPGFEWRYNSALPNLLLKCIDNMEEEGVWDWAHTNFYAKLGIVDYNWQSQPDGYPEGAARMYMRPRDMLKVGITYLNNGMWNGAQVIPENWVKECFQVKENTTSGDYSYHFWLRSLGDVTYLSADGDGGNFINIFPEQNMVIVVTQGNYLRWPFYVNQVNDLTKNYILPAILD